MKNLFALLLPAVSACAVAVGFSPQPVSLVETGGAFAYDGGTRIFYETRDTARPIEDTLEPLAGVLAGELEMLTGIKPALVEQTGGNVPGEGDISLEFAPITGEFAASEEDEDQSYTLTVADTVVISSQYYKGVAYGTTTLLQALEEDTGSYSIPKMTVNDAPASAYRTIMIDVARQPSAIDMLMEVVRLARQYKLRYLQIHLTDDQHFTFPFTPVTDALSNNFTYARSDLEDLVAYADARGVTIIPELDLPGHSSRLRASGYLNPTANDADVAHPDNYEKIEAIIDDMLDVFTSSPYFHIGGDESGAGHALVPFLEAVNDHLRGKPAGEKKRLIVWEGFGGSPTTELPATGDDRIVVISWESSYNPPWNLLNSGYPVVNGSWKPLYVVGSGATTRWPHVAQRLWPAEVIHTWEKDLFMHWQPGRPVFEDNGPNDPVDDDHIWDAGNIGRESQVIGGQMLSWEQNEKTIVRDLLPRLPVFADRLWNPVDEDFSAYAARAEAVKDVALTIVQPVEILPLGPLPMTPVDHDYRRYDGDSVTITLRNRTKIPGTIRYEIGSFNNSRVSPGFSIVPATTASSTAYSGPFSRSGGFGIRAALYRSDDGTALDGHDWQHYNNFENVVEVTEYEVPDRPMSTVPDFAAYTNDKIIEVYGLPLLHGPYTVEKVRGQMYRAVLNVPGTGDYTFSVETADGHASLYLDIDKDGVWDAEEKLITDSPSNSTLATAQATLAEGKYLLRVDHASGAVGPIVWVKMDGPGTGGSKDVTSYIEMPPAVDAPPMVPQLLFPANGETGVRSNRSMQWTSAGVDTYDVFIWKDGTAKPGTPTATGLTTASHTPEGLEAGTLYRWTVAARNVNGVAESAESVFTTSAGTSGGAAIGWNYQGVGGVGLSDTDFAGAPGFEQENWNNHAGSGQGPGNVPLALEDSAGNATTAEVVSWTLSTANSWQHSQTATPDQILMNDFSDKDPSIGFAGIPYSGYDVVVYYGNNEGPSTATLTVGRETRTITTGNTAQSSVGSVGYVEGTDANTTSPTNFSVFTGLSGSSLTVAISGGTNNGISAIQIVEGEPVEESDTPAIPAYPLDESTGFKPWQPICWVPGGAGEISYDLYLWPDGEAKPATPTATVEGPEYLPPAYLAASTTYRWQVITNLESGGTLTSDEFTFTTGDLTGQPPFDVSDAGRAARDAENDAKKGMEDLLTAGGAGYPIPDGTTLAFYGDSITDVLTYFDVLQAALQAAKTNDAAFPDVTVLNRGINGATSDDLLNLPDGDQFSGGSGPNPPVPFKQQVDADLAVLPTGGTYIAIIQIGINDVLQGDNTSKAVYKARLEEMVDYVLGKGHLVAILSHTVINESPIADITDDGLFDDPGNALLNQYIEAQEEIATARSIPFVNQREAYLNVYRNENVVVGKDAAGTITFPATTGILNGDSVHPNARGKALSSEFAATGIYEAVTNLAPPGEIAVSPGNLTFSDQDLGSESASQTLTISNLDDENNLIVSGVTTGGAHPDDFTAVGTVSGIIAPGGNLEIAIVFKPVGLGARTADVIILSNDEDEGMLAVPVSGTALAALPAAPTSPSPADDATEVAKNTLLDWSDAAGATSYDVFLWVNGETMPTVPTGTVTTSGFDPGLLEVNTVYLWQVVSRNAAGTAPGPMWSFTTQEAETPSVGWNFTRNESLEPGEIAGAPGFEQENWNNHAANGQGPGNVPLNDLIDNSGAATTLDVVAWTHDTNNSWFHNTTSATNTNEKLMYDFATKLPSITFDEVPYARYDVVVYYGNNEGPSPTSLMVGDQSRTITSGTTALCWIGNVGWLEGTDENTDSPTNFSVFRGLTQSTVTVAIDGNPNFGNGICAVQFLEAPELPGGFDFWQANTPGAGAGFAANTDNDALNDLAEYAFGADPAVADQPGSLPFLDATSGSVSLVFSRPVGISDVLYEVEGTLDWETWFMITDITPTVETAGDLETLTFSELETTSDLPGISADGKAYFRIRLTLL